MSTRGKALLALCLITPAPTLGVLPFLMDESPTGTALWAAAKVWTFALPAVWHVLVDRKPPSLSPPTRGGFGMGLLTGLIAAGVIIGGYLLVGGRFIDPEKLRGVVASRGLDRQAVYLAAVMYWVLVNSVLEEYVFRWFIVRKCEVLMGGTAAIAASALIFVVHHSIAMASYFPWWMNFAASVSIFIAGATWSWLYIRYRSVWVPYLSHALADIAIFGIGWYMLFGTPR